ncbi:hypothetical protein C0Q70_02016 [Pomacea canaliculata]|uniref:Uncharacterized protein n=1 Tax=Pomacea canaliculata TaxID=400727 RepID=A0A2T7Q134_POMCA|nr:hypothetical protein C0Q70_02016 [Pomacea canaliculata]
MFVSCLARGDLSCIRTQDNSPWQLALAARPVCGCTRCGNIEESNNINQLPTPEVDNETGDGCWMQTDESHPLGLEPKKTPEALGVTGGALHPVLEDVEQTASRSRS